VHHKVQFVISGQRPPLLPTDGRPILWITGSPPVGPGFQTHALNSVPDLQVIAGDRSSPGAILPWFASNSQPTSPEAQRQQLDQISGLAVFLPPPDSPLPWWPLTGR
jgi:hypothetical protein